LVFYWSGLFDASENDYIFDDYIGVLVYTLIGGFYHAETKLAKIYISTTSTHAPSFLHAQPHCSLPHMLHAWPACCVRWSVNARASRTEKRSTDARRAAARS
jgi:hypothetical protein